MKPKFSSRHGSRIVSWAPWQVAAMFLCVASAEAASSTAFSPVITVDTRVVAVAVSGRVLDAASRAPISGAAVSLAGQNTSSSGAGLFSFASVSASGGALTVSKSGYATYTGSVPIPAGASSVTLPDILLSPAPANQPVITGLRPRYEGMFLGGIALMNDFTATVNWQGLTPNSVRFYVNGNLAATVSTTGNEATATLDMGLGFAPSFSPGANTVRVVAEAGNGATSVPYETTVRVIPTPFWLTGLPARLLGGNDATYSFNLTYPSDKYPVKALQTIPFLGDFGWDLQFIGGYEYALGSGDWLLYAGVQPTKSISRVGARPPSSLTNPKFYAGNTEINFGVKVLAEGTATQTQGIMLNEAGVVVFVDVQQELLTFYLSDYVPGAQWLRILDRLKWLGVDVNSIQRVRVYGLLEGEFRLMLQFQPAPAHFNGADINLSLGLEAAYEPDVKVAKIRTYVGGKVNGEFQIPYPNPAFRFKRITGLVYGGVSIESWLFDAEEEFVILQGTLWQAAAAASKTAGATGGTAEEEFTTLILPAGHREFGPLRRDYLRAGPERFTAGQSALPRGSEGHIAALEDFRSLGRAPTGGRKSGDVSAAGDPPTASAQADLVLVENVFPGSAPAMADKGQELMLLYVGDNGTANTLQSTDIRWMRFDGTDWSAPATIHANTQAEFAPQVAYDGNGDALAVWERVADPAFDTPELEAMAAEMEIVWAKWSHTSGQWSAPQPLTANGHLDHAPLLCGPMADGSVLGVWTANASNLLMGTNGAGSQVLWAQWHPSSQSWTSPQTLLADLPYRLSQSLSGVSNLAVYAWSRDLDGDQGTVADQQVFFAEWVAGTWGAPAQMTADNAGHRNVRVSVAPNLTGASGEGFETGDFSGQTWTFTGESPWVVQSGTVASGGYAAASGTITHNQCSGMKVTLDCQAGEVSFAYAVSSEVGFDFLRFYIDGVQQTTWSGSVGWTNVSYPVTAGAHTFEWRYTKDGSVSSGNDKVWVDDIVFPVASGQPAYFVWQQGSDLVLSVDKGVTVTVVRSEVQSLGFADYALTLGPAGNLAVLWQDMTETGADAHYRILDTAAKTWSQDVQLFHDRPLERSFAPVWDNAGNLAVAYNKVEIVYTNKTVNVEGVGEVTVENVPQPGRVDLCVTKRALVKDLALQPGDFTVSADNYLPGAAVTLAATVRNAGDLAVSNVVVAFYQGNPTNGGVLITNVAIAGWLDGAATNTVSALWVVPEPATNHLLYAVADPAGAIAEFDEANNQLSLSLGGTDLAVSLVSHSAETNGAVRVIAQVQNLGAPSATNSVLAIRREGQTNSLLATVAVPLLEPGRLATVALDLPPGTHPEGEAVYRLFADETKVVADVDTNNNTTAFAVNLWVDSDGDGLPDSYENQYSFLDPHDPDDALLDYDEDGVSNVDEYRAGTAPDDPLSYLRLTAITVGGSEGVEIAWGSSPNKLYTVQRSATLEAGFTNLVEHIQSTPPENVYLDTSATNAAAFFYRIMVE
ncbi:MAG: carboxypeptidase regulatory-like domain-containing protein [Verrucomicrobiae bacterium]|nr:carboxypeptidase regulatory-like domain-containing protein [Verrucomicrobiae bacterium]